MTDSADNVVDVEKEESSVCVCVCVCGFIKSGKYRKKSLWRYARGLNQDGDRYRLTTADGVAQGCDRDKSPIIKYGLAGLVGNA